SPRTLGRRLRCPVSRGWPGMSLSLQCAAPSIERVIHDHAVAQQIMIIGNESFQALRNRQKPRRLRREIWTRGIRAAHNRRQLRKRDITSETILGEKSVEAALLADMAELDARHIVGYRARLFCDGEYAIGWHV